MRATDAEGNMAMIKLWSTFDAVIEQPDAEEMLPYVVVPSEVPRLIAALPWLRAELAVRRMTNRPELAAPEVVYLKLVPRARPSTSSR